MKKILLPVVFICTLTACERSSSYMQCGDYRVSDITFTPDGTIMDAYVNDTLTRFYLVQSASGSKYDGVYDAKQMILWSRGEAWTMFINDGPALECK